MIKRNSFGLTIDIKNKYYYSKIFDAESTADD